MSQDRTPAPPLEPLEAELEALLQIELTEDLESKGGAMKLPIVVTREQFEELEAMAARYDEDDWEWLAGLYTVLGDEIVNWMRELRAVPPEFALEIEGEGIVYPYPPKRAAKATPRRRR